MLPKLLLKLSISDRIEQEQSITTTTTTNLTDQIEYILDARMDDLAPVLDNFYVNKTNGELFLIKPLDRDPPNGKYILNLYKLQQSFHSLNTCRTSNMEIFGSST